MTHPKRRTRSGWVIFFECTVAAMLLGPLAQTAGRWHAARFTPSAAPAVTPMTTDSAVIGKDYPREYRSWEATKQMAENTKYGGSSYRDYLKADPRLVVLWAGYPFAKGYNQARGHYHAIEDVVGTKRVNQTTPATCWTCKSPDVPRMMAAVGGPANFYKQSFDHFRNDITHPIGCADCHDPVSMELRISRPALKEALTRQGKDVTKLTRQQMRSLVCAQCHVEYYFQKGTNYLNLPWDNGRRAEDFEKYYYKPGGHVDFTHAISGAPIRKMQHPDYEVWSMGVHAYRGVSCADCHMPKTTQGGATFTNHQIRSPLYMVAQSCRPCHKWSATDIRARVYNIQDKNRQMLDDAEDTITAGHLEIGEAIKRGATDAELAAPRDLISRAQMYWDYVAASNGMGFHAPQECGRLLTKAVSLGSLSRLETTRVLARHGILGPVLMPDISSVEKAQAYIAPFVSAQNAALERAKQEHASEAEQKSKAEESGKKTP